MRTTPFRFSVTSDELARFPEAVGHLAIQRSVVELPEISFQPMPHPHDGLCHDIHGDHPFGMYVVRGAVIRGHAGIMCTPKAEFFLEQNAGLLDNDQLLQQMARVAAHPSRGTGTTVEHLISLISTCTDCFWHWMMDSLPKAFIAEQSGYSGSYLVPSGGPTAMRIESMELLGIEPSRLITQASDEYRVRNLSIPTYFSGFNAPFNPIFMRAYRDHILSHVAPSSSSPEKIYVARKPDAKNRRVVNHDEVEALARRAGFTTVYFEDLSLQEQIAVASRARTMIAPHGSGMTHTLFMPESSSIIEFFPYQRRASCDCYERLAPVVSHRYAALESVSDCSNHVEVDLHELEDILKDQADMT